MLWAHLENDEAVTTRLISVLSESGGGRWYARRYEVLPELADEIALTGDVIVAVVPGRKEGTDFGRLVRQVTLREQAAGSQILFPVIVEESDLESLEETLKTHVERSAADFRGLASGDALDRAISGFIDAIMAIHHPVES